MVCPAGSFDKLRINSNPPEIRGLIKVGDVGPPAATRFENPTVASR